MFHFPASSRCIVLTALVADALVLGIGGSIFLAIPDLLVESRNVAFGSFTSDLDLFRMPPSQFAPTTGFKSDDAKLILEYRKPVFASLQVEESALGRGDEYDAVRYLASRFRGVAGEKIDGVVAERCGISSNLLDNVRIVAQGNACCSDYSEVAIAAALQARLAIREVHHRAHTFNEYFDAKRNKWIYIDFMYAAMARDERGDYLGLAEIARSMHGGKQPRYDFFGAGFIRPGRILTRDHPLIQDPYNFEWLAITLGNNVHAVDKWRAQIGWAPKPVYQLAGYVLGIVPGYLIFVRSPATCALLWLAKWGLWTLAFVVLAANLGGIAVLVRSQFAGR